MNTRFWERVPLRWGLFIAASTTITVLFAIAGWALNRYAVSVANESIQTEMRASVRAYQAVWKTRTQVLSSSTALMSGMSDVRAAFMTRDAKTIRDSAQDLWARVSDTTAVFLVLDAEGHLISSLGSSGPEERLKASAIPLEAVLRRFPTQVSGFLREGTELFYVVLTPVYVQTSREPILLNVLCAGFPVDTQLADQLRELASDTEFAFAASDVVFASTLDQRTSRLLPPKVASNRMWLNRFVVASQVLNDVSGKPIAQLYVLHSYDEAQRSLEHLQRSFSIAWLATMAAGLLLSLFFTRRMLFPVRLLDFAAARIAARDYGYRVPVGGSGELSRLARTFNEMCDSIQQTQAELVSQEQMATIARLGSSLVHDLRNPLAAIYAGAEMLIDGDLPAEQTGRVSRNIYRASQRMQDLLRDLMNVSKGDSRVPEFCAIGEIVEAAIESVSSQTDRICIAVDGEIECEVLCDRMRVERVFANLLSNAAEAMPHAGRITISARVMEGRLQVRVEDTGAGVPAHIRAELFRPFVTGKRSGLGLGLALSRQTMVEAGGSLWLEAEGDGRGACFVVEFSRIRETRPGTSIQ